VTADNADVTKKFRDPRLIYDYCFISFNYLKIINELRFSNISGKLDVDKFLHSYEFLDQKQVRYTILYILKHNIYISIERRS
jgi:hypothetical protein